MFENDSKPAPPLLGAKAKVGLHVGILKIQKNSRVTSQVWGITKMYLKVIANALLSRHEPQIPTGTPWEIFFSFKKLAALLLVLRKQQKSLSKSLHAMTTTSYTSHTSKGPLPSFGASKQIKYAAPLAPGRSFPYSGDLNLSHNSKTYHEGINLSPHLECGPGYSNLTLLTVSRNARVCQLRSNLASENGEGFSSSSYSLFS